METKDKRRFDPETGERNVAVAEEPKHEIEPRNEWVLVRKIFREEKTSEAGVVQLAGGRSQRGIVVAAGPKTNLLPGDFVVFTNFPLDLPDLEELTGQSDLQLVREEEIYAKIRKVVIQ